MTVISSATLGQSGGDPGEAAKIYKVAYLVSHPIQYQAPLLRLLANQPDIDLTVFFQSDLSVKSYYDVGFGRSIEWDTPLLSGYKHEFLPAIGSRDSVEGWRPFNYGIVSRLWNGQFDVLWVHGYARWFNWVGMIAARLMGTRILIRDEATPISAQRSRLKTALKRYFFGVLGVVCDGFLNISSLNRAYYVANGIAPSRIFPVPYCVDNEYFKTRSEQAAAVREKLRAELGLSLGCPVILYASKLQARKRASDLLAAYGKLMGRWENELKPYLLFVGDGEARSELEAQAAPWGDRVRFCGFRNQSELPVWYDLCNVFVLPSQLEPFGLIVNEVMNAGRPIIVSNDVGCGPDLVQPGINGYRYPVGDVDALAEALWKILSDRDVQKEMGHASAEIIANWNYETDIDGIRRALAFVLKQDKTEI